MYPARAPRPTILRQRSWFLALAVIAAATCGADSARREASETTPTTQHSDARPPVGLAIEIDNGVGQPLPIQQGQRFYLNQIDMRTSVDGSVANFDFRGKSENLVSAIQWLTDAKTPPKSNFATEPA